jgi:hypothetical protein
MVRVSRFTIATLLFLGAILHPDTASAGPVWDWLWGPCCPPSYCPAHYWSPTLVRACDCIKGPHLSVYAPDRHPEIPPSMAILKYKCPPVGPEATIYTVPLAPSSSGFKYFARPGDTTSDESNDKNQAGDSTIPKESIEKKQP